MKILRIPLVIVLLVLAGRAFDAGAQTETNLYSFVGSPTDGATPYAGLVQGSDGYFYGTTVYGGSTNYNSTCACNGYGTIFRISPSGTETNLYSFGSSSTDGQYPNDGLAQGSDGNFYGTTSQGGTTNQNYGATGYGTVFRISPGGTYSNLYSFSGYPSDGQYPYDGLVQGSDGNFYGTTYGGGAGNDGTVFRISPSGTETNLHSFGYPTDGASPNAGLVQGSDGNFYGTTIRGGTSSSGTVFRISPSGSYTSLYSFAGSPTDGADPYAGLVQGSDGNFYGTTVGGGMNTNYNSFCRCYGYGTVFRFSPSGSYTNLHSFAGDRNDDGANPYAGLVQGSDGKFYGTTIRGGTNNGGTVFRISPGGSETILYSFVGAPADGGHPEAGLVQGSDGNFYGTTAYGGANNDGTVFKLTVPLSPPANQISDIQFFNVLDSTIIALPIPSVAGETYQLQYSDSMSPTNWLNTGGTMTSIGGPLVLIDIAEPLPPQRFYRAVITP
jgi:uncharacterized repeat protein (TIGR03803 family)